uniref:Phosphatidylinositide phosphatase SAC2 n=2 Tax=Aceria tosichella TaxID=561515 RepID=A0A6G1SNP8_9ACAR
MDESYDLLTGDHFHVILHPNKQHGLIFNRLDRTVTTINYDDAKELSNVKYVGRIYGIVGRFLDRHLVLIKNRNKVGSLYEPLSKTDHDVYVISQVQVIDLSITATTQQSNTATSRPTNSVKYDATSDKDDFVDTSQHREFQQMEMQQSDSFSSLPITINTNSYLSSQSRSSNWNPFKLANSLKPMVPTQFLRSAQANSGPGVQSNDNGQQSNAGSSRLPPVSQTAQIEEADKRLVEEMTKLFNNTNSFYYSPTLDLTNRFSRVNLIKKIGNEPVWMAADERFFWNKYMLADLIELSKQDIDANRFICVILKGFIAIKEQAVGPTRQGSESDFGDLGADGQQATGMRFLNTSRNASNNNLHCDTDSSRQQILSESRYKSKTYKLALVSRRSVFQAGTRYRRRGCDKDGNCANYVETEQIFKADHHFTSMVILRGSIPLFWYQSGFNYRPPPVLTKSEEENHEAFSKHFKDLIHQYGTEQIIAVDCTEQSGREKALHDTYKRHIDKFKLSHPKIRLIEFDYHKYCRGRQCTDAQIEFHLNACGLTEQLLKDVKYYWNDGEVVLEQEGVFRVNCIDCTDRTNVVQRIIALQILDLQLARLGIIAPDISPEENQCKRIMQTMWSTNGNVLSTQYCGTRALFGGDRKLAGYLKDTYSSASRYYISKFRDVYRQAAIDAMLGIENVEAKNLETSQLRDPYESLGFDPLLAGQRGGAILRDVGSRVTNRLARLKGKFNVKPESDLSSSFARYQQQQRSNVASGIAETGLIETLGEMTIDWPSSEDLTGQPIETGQEVQEVPTQDVFERYATYDDNFQDDDEFSHLMLSIDLAELQQLRDQDGGEPRCADTHGCPGEFKCDEENQPEEIDLKEARGISSQPSGKEQTGVGEQHTNTTAT